MTRLSELADEIEKNVRGYSREHDGCASLYFRVKDLDLIVAILRDIKLEQHYDRASQIRAADEANEACRKSFSTAYYTLDEPHCDLEKVDKSIAKQLSRSISRNSRLLTALQDVRKELWVDYCLSMNTTKPNPQPFNDRPHIRIIDNAVNE